MDPKNGECKSKIYGIRRWMLSITSRSAKAMVKEPMIPSPGQSPGPFYDCGHQCNGGGRSIKRDGPVTVTCKFGAIHGLLGGLEGDGSDQRFFGGKQPEELLLSLTLINRMYIGKHHVLFSKLAIAKFRLHEIFFCIARIPFPLQRGKSRCALHE